MASNNFWDIFSESRNIFKAHSRHLQTLSLIFLFPFSFSLILSPTLSNIFYHFYTNIISLPSPTTNPQNYSLFFHLLYSLLRLVLSTCGVISITYSVFHFINDQSANLKSAIKSISTSLLPLLATTIISQLIIFFMCLYYWLLMVLLTYVAVVFRVTNPFSSPYVIPFFAALPLLLVLIYLQVNWTLAPVIAVVESCWGLEPLRRSARLISGMKGVALSSFFFYGFFEGIVVLNCLFVTKDSNGISGNWVLVVCNWVLIVSQSYFVAVFMLSNIALNTVLYTHCKANHGDELVEEFGKDDVSLPFHDGKVSNAV